MGHPRTVAYAARARSYPTPRWRRLAPTQCKLFSSNVGVAGRIPALHKVYVGVCVRVRVRVRVCVCV